MNRSIAGGRGDGRVVPIKLNRDTEQRRAMAVNTAVDSSSPQCKSSPITSTGRSLATSSIKSVLASTTAKLRSTPIPRAVGSSAAPSRSRRRSPARLASSPWRARPDGGPIHRRLPRPPITPQSSARPATSRMRWDLPIPASPSMSTKRPSPFAVAVNSSSRLRARPCGRSCPTQAASWNGLRPPTDATGR